MISGEVLSRVAFLNDPTNKDLKISIWNLFAKVRFSKSIEIARVRRANAILILF